MMYCISNSRSLADTFIAGVASLLKHQIRQQEYDVTQQLTEGSEALQHVRIALAEADFVASNGLLLDSVQHLFNSCDSEPLTIVLEGEGGSGKTAMVSQIAKMSSLWQPLWKIVFRSLGYTLRTSSLFRTLESLIKQLNFIYSLDMCVPIHASLQEALEIFCQILKRVAEVQRQKASGKLLLILDHLDKLSELDEHFILSILNSLDDGIVLILTFDSKCPLLTMLKSREATKTLRMSGLNKVEINDFIHVNLPRLNRRVTDDQMKNVLRAIPSDASPLYLQLVFHIIRRWPSHTLPELSKFTGRADVDFSVFLAVLEADLGKAFTRYALSFMAVARHGLGDNEIVHLLSEDADLLNEIKEEQVESVSVVEGFSCQFHLSRLLAYLGKFVMEVKMEGETIFQISSRAFINSIKNKYLSDSFFYTVHKRLATFFQFIRRGVLLSSKDISERNQQHLVNLQWRTLRSVPYHLCYSSDNPTEVWQNLKEKVFFNFSWIINEVYSGFYNDFLNDIKFALEHVDLDPHIQYLQNFLVNIRHTVVHNPMSLAAIFSSQNIQETDSAKDSIRSIVNDAREWLKQIHTQALVPEKYTSDKTNRLFIKRNCVKGVDEILTDRLSDKLFLLKGRSLCVAKMVSGEEIQLTEFDNDIRDLYITENDGQIVALIESSKSDDDEEKENTSVAILNPVQGSSVKVISLGTSNLLWFDLRSSREAYFATNGGIKYLNMETGKINNMLSMKIDKEWVASHITLGSAKIITCMIEEKLKMDILAPKEGDFRRLSFKKQELNKNCEHILSTKDGKYIVLIFDREAVVVDALKYEELETISLNGLPIIRAIFSRSHEHLFLGYANGALTCHVLYTGNESMSSKFIPKQHRFPIKQRYKAPLSRPSSGFASPSPIPSTDGKSSPIRHNQSPHVDKKDDKKNAHDHHNSDVETITTMVTSEDDHFLFCGTNQGTVYAIHVPTGLQAAAIFNQHKAVKRMLFLTNREHFQHLVVLNDEGKSFHWNLRPLLK